MPIELDYAEPWFDRRALAKHLGCSVRSVELRVAEGMPAWKVMGRVKFRLSEVTPWLMEHGHISRVLDDGCTVVAGSANGAATADTAPPHDQGGNP